MQQQQNRSNRLRWGAGIILSIILFQGLLGIGCAAAPKGVTEPLKAEMQPVDAGGTEGNILWNKTWDSDYDVGYDVWGDGVHTYVTGHTNKSGTADVIVIKMDASGNQIWNRTWDAAADFGTAIWGDGTNIYVTGRTNKSGSTDLVIIKWDANGNQLWNQTWGGIAEDSGKDLVGNSTHIYTVGDTKSFGAGFGDIAIILWSATGSILWNRTWGNSSQETVYSILKNGNDLYITGRYGTPFVHGFIAKFDSNANMIWNNTQSEIDGWSGIWGDETNIYTTGYVVNPGSIFLMALGKYTLEGTQIWIKMTPSTTASSGRALWGDSDFLYATGNLNNDFILVKWDKSGIIRWNKTFGNTNSEIGYGIWGAGTDLYTVGTVDRFSPKMSDIFLTKWSIDYQPWANFSINRTLNFVNQSIACTFDGYEGNHPATLQWSFSDNSTNSTIRNPTHQYTAAGNFTVVLSVIDADGDISVKKIGVNIMSPGNTDTTTTEEKGIAGFSLWGIVSSIAISIGILLKKKKLTITQ
jgi:PKD domain